MKDNSKDDLVISLISLVKGMNNSPSKEGYREIKKRTSTKSLPASDSSEVFDIIPNTSEDELSLQPQTEFLVPTEFDPSRYFALEGNLEVHDSGQYDGNTSPTIERNPGQEYYEPMSFGVPTPAEKPSNYTSREVLEMIRELKALRA